MIFGAKWVTGGLVLLTIPMTMSAQNRWARQVHDQLQRALDVAHAQVAESALLSKEGTLNQEESEIGRAHV